MRYSKPTGMYLNELKRKEINMGYRCPGCGKDFGLDKESLYHHLDFESGECSAYAHAVLANVKIMLGDKSYVDKKLQDRKRISKSYSRISPNHNWVKQNIVSDENGCDVVVCTKCGIKAKRRMDNFYFDMRQSMKKIENCIDE